MESWLTPTLPGPPEGLTPTSNPPFWVALRWGPKGKPSRRQGLDIRQGVALARGGITKTCIRVPAEGFITQAETRSIR